VTSVFKIRKKIVNFTKFLKFVKIRFITHWYLQSLRIRTTLATVENNSVECEQWTVEDCDDVHREKGGSSQ